ncbi:YihY/virulence factor BrkB family protein [Bradyrhizobium sp. HKCCYLS1011]|uniref:YihY/virulence factor BrkB family protein n=1 Tax=Bradyrhizobium sp. HKCCYLS1011 TaxID=3420733 RepID=UPI003EBA940E
MFGGSKQPGAGGGANVPAQSTQSIRLPGVGSVLALLGIAVLVQYIDRRPADRDGQGSREERRSGGGLEPGRGRLASTPSEIPARGWKDIMVRLYEDLSEHRILAFAAGMTFYSLLAIFPALAALVAIYGLFADPASISAHLEQLNGLMPGGAIDIARDQLTRVSSKGSQALSLTFVVSLVISLWSANAAMKSLFDSLNVVYGEREHRSFIRLNAISLLFTVGAIVFAVLALGAIVVVPIVLNYVGLSGAADTLLRLGRWPAIFVCIALALALIYRYGPDREQPKWRWISWGSALAAALWLIASLLFSWYTANFGSYNATYGSLGAVVGFMTWLWISATVILIGAELDAELEHQTARDTTTGAAKPLGTRGAAVADTVGHAS